MLKNIEVEKISSSSNVRNEKDDSLFDLMASIAKNGLLQPIVVQETKKGYEVISGHRRLEAVRLLGEPFIECMIVDSVSRQERVILQLEENIHRKQMSAYELVQSFDALIDKYGCTDKQIAVMIHKPAQWIYDQRYAVKLLEKEYKSAGKEIPEDKKKLSASTIRAAAKNRRKQPEAMKIDGNGFSAKIHGHTYMIYCSGFEFEKKLTDLMNDNK